MKTQRFEVLSQAEVERIDAASMEILAEVGIQVPYKKAQVIFREAGAKVDEATSAVKIPEKLVRWAVDQALSAKTAKGAFGPVAYRLMKGLAKD